VSILIGVGGYVGGQPGAKTSRCARQRAALRARLALCDAFLPYQVHVVLMEASASIKTCVALIE
jgi:hypothetical protein